jgi:hypothetical protein
LAADSKRDQTTPEAVEDRGQITRTRGGPRVIQLGVKYRFSLAGRPPNRSSSPPRAHPGARGVLHTGTIAGRTHPAPCVSRDFVVVSGTGRINCVRDERDESRVADVLQRSGRHPRMRNLDGRSAGVATGSSRDRGMAWQFAGAGGS